MATTTTKAATPRTRKTPLVASGRAIPAAALDVFARAGLVPVRDQFYRPGPPACGCFLGALLAAIRGPKAALAAALAQGTNRRTAEALGLAPAYVDGLVLGWDIGGDLLSWYHLLGTAAREDPEYAAGLEDGHAAYLAVREQHDLIF